MTGTDADRHGPRDHHHLIETARSWLFVPASRPALFDKAAASGADVVILDLEDAVASPQKAAARNHAVDWIAGGNTAAVRINAADSSQHLDDVDALVGLTALAAVIVPMAASSDVLRSLHERLGPEVALVPQVETATGLVGVHDLAKARGVVRMAFGHLDFAFDVDASPSSQAMTLARSTLVLASRAAGRVGPIDSVTTSLDSETDVSEDATFARSLGFTAKLCIHPKQVAPVNHAMSPTADDVAWASEVVNRASSGAAIRIRGQMIDRPVLARAQRILRVAGRRGENRESE
ncbi:HpcH/HpaI aldolase/citrate lyase family protein [Dactylosporangium sp. NPDC000521]|uniref:HpcH/HpaI aldolase/citrate lyase family protein n=1 Tax=Dactylosporangium sp. NPDC000521 TaxID=3363975 RepID=UPI0036974A2A